jgi:hypothetical protein
MTVQELIAQLAEMPLSATITVRVDCPHGGNSLPADIFKVYEIDPKFRDGKVTAVIVCDPEEGVEFEVQDAEDYEPDFGQCGKCGQWVHFPCYTCIARQAEQVLAPKVDGEQALSLHLDHVAETRERERLDF